MRCMAKAILNSSLSLLCIQYFAAVRSIFLTTKQIIFLLQILNWHSCRKRSSFIYIPTDPSVRLTWNKLPKTFIMKDGYINVHWWGELMLIHVMTHGQGTEKCIHNDATYSFRIWKVKSDLLNLSDISLAIFLLANKCMITSDCTCCYLYIQAVGAGFNF